MIHPRSQPANTRRRTISPGTRSTSAREPGCPVSPTGVDHVNDNRKIRKAHLRNSTASDRYSPCESSSPRPMAHQRRIACPHLSQHLAAKPAPPHAPRHMHGGPSRRFDIRPRNRRRPTQWHNTPQVSIGAHRLGIKQVSVSPAPVSKRMPTNPTQLSAGLAALREPPAPYPRPQRNRQETTFNYSDRSNLHFPSFSILCKSRNFIRNSSVDAGSAPVLAPYKEDQKENFLQNSADEAKLSERKQLNIQTVKNNRIFVYNPSIRTPSYPLESP